MKPEYPGAMEEFTSKRGISPLGLWAEWWVVKPGTEPKVFGTATFMSVNMASSISSRLTANVERVRLEVMVTPISSSLQLGSRAAPGPPLVAKLENFLFASPSAT